MHLFYVERVKVPPYYWVMRLLAGTLERDRSRSLGSTHRHSLVHPVLVLFGRANDVARREELVVHIAHVPVDYISIFIFIRSIKT